MDFFTNLLKVILYQPLYNILMFFVAVLPGNSVGIAIIVLTLIIRIILYPSTKNALIAQKKIRKLQPKLEEIKKLHKGDSQAQNAALMELYKEEKVNPLGSCLPLLVQMPIFFVLYKVFINGLDVSRFNLLYNFVPTPESVNTVFLGINLSQKKLIILPIITAALQFWQSKQLMPSTAAKTDKPDPTQMVSKQMMYVFPVIIFITARSLPAALPLYWSVNSLFSIAQQWYLLREKTEDLEEKLEKLPTPYKEVAKKDKVEYARGKDVQVTIRKKSSK